MTFAELLSVDDPGFFMILAWLTHFGLKSSILNRMHWWKYELHNRQAHLSKKRHDEISNSCNYYAITRPPHHLGNCSSM